MIPERPESTMPCTGCGECCREKMCKPGQDAYPGVEAPCPGLLWKNGRYWCALIKKEASEYGEKKMAAALGIGLGCYKNRNPRLSGIDDLEELSGVIKFINREDK